MGKENALLSSQLGIFEARFTGKLDTWAVSVNAELEKKFSPLQTQIAAMEVLTRTTHWVVIFGGFSTGAKVNMVDSVTGAKRKMVDSEEDGRLRWLLESTA